MRRGADAPRRTVSGLVSGVAAVAVLRVAAVAVFGVLRRVVLRAAAIAAVLAVVTGFVHGIHLQSCP